MESLLELQVEEDLPPPLPPFIHLSGAYIIIFAILGCFVRILLLDLFTYSFQPVFPLLWSQVIGCFLIGYFSVLRPSYRLSLRFKLISRNTDLLMGLSVGFCGSLTSFSGMFGDVYVALTTTKKTAILGTVSIIMTTLLSSFAAFCAGRKVPKFEAVRTLGHIGPWVVAFSAWICVAVLAALDVKRKTTLSLVLAPPGALFRWQLSRLNLQTPNFPTGTFIANVLATIFSTVMIIIRNRHLGCMITFAISVGFDGCLSTISTFIAELHRLASRDSLRYGTLSIASGFVISILGAIDGWKNENSC